MDWRPAMTKTGDGQGLLLTYNKGVYSFFCENATNCYWKSKPYSLEIERPFHVMFRVPASLVDEC